MCFSAQASFGASLVLGFIGIYALRKARPQEHPLALVPLLFSIQQACEGVVWVTHADPAYTTLTNLATYAFCFFAFFVWPVWIPFTALCMEANPLIKKVLWAILFLGSCVSGFLMYCVIVHGIGLEISCSHIKYDIVLPGILNTLGTVFYCIATILPFFISSKRWMPFFGILTGISIFITCYFYNTYFISIWCFLAALLSSVIVLMV